MELTHLQSYYVYYGVSLTVSTIEAKPFVSYYLKRKYQDY